MFQGLIVDNFAGGGGASTGIEAALGHAVDFAINHDEEAIRMHEANHPGTVHIRNNIWQIDPLEVTGGKPVDLAWFSPDCKHFSKAKGGKPREKSIRDLAWVVVHWVKRLQAAARRAGDPEWRKIIKVIGIENVEEFRTWGPLDDAGMPIKELAGTTFAQWCAELRKAGGRIEWKELRACDYGAPTIRKRFFMVVRFDGEEIMWPEPTHGKPCSPEVLSGKRLPWRTAAEIIDWSIQCPSIFDRKKPLAEKTLRRIAHGIMKFVVNNPAPFIVPLTHHQAGARGASVDQPMATVTGANRGEHAIVMPHVTKFRSGATGHDIGEPLHTVTANSFVKRPGGSAPLGLVEVAAAPFATYAQQGGANRSLEDPLHTVTASKKDQNCVAAAHLVHIGNGERQGQAPRAMDVEAPLGTVVAGGIKHHAVTAFMQKFAQNGQGVDPGEPLHTVMAGAPRHAVVCAHVEQANGGPKNENLAGRAADAPLSTVATAGSQQRLVTSNLLKLRGTSRDGQPTDEPLHTVSAGGLHMGEVRAFLIKYYGNEQDGHGLESPLGTVTVQDRFGLVTVMIEGEEYVIVDIGMRMLTPRELFNAQGFPADYIIDRDAHGAPITKTAQVAKCGNSVCPPMAEALVRAQFGLLADHSERVAA
ncbi:DNA (cytosine-5)-methyltransferase 1 [Sphingobium sp. YR657]|uniref:DNA cytosine methyltransferase n=1 Tax=Sphingobium sp. YR657 TaxID=1884366 RepID=UPI000914CE10|nr:DNA cytosine methyltransferase [Sphingobium sp. YR657]SHL97336.1 DNA (cytosine-5)-methyltransferase 1 [Sphingobium sp. YR657]